MKLKHSIALLGILGIYFQGLAYSITGLIVDEDSHKPLHHAFFEARNADNRVVIGNQSAQDGRFMSGEVTDSLLNIMVYHQDYDTLYMKLQGMPEGLSDLGVIALRRTAEQLKELTVTASPVVQGVDKFIVYPTAREVDQSATSLGLLDQLQYRLPGLRVIETLGQVTIYGQAPQYLINGRKVQYSRILGLNNDDILRIEYYDNPQLRFGDRPAINFIMKPRTDGGSVFASARSAVTTGSAAGNLGLTYFRGKSEWNLNYHIDHRSYNDRRVSFHEEFFGRPEIVSRTGTGQPGKFAYTTNYLALDYTFMPSSKTLFAVNVAGSLYRQNLNDIADIRQTTGSITQNFTTSTYRTANIKTPSADLYLRHNVKQNHTIEANAFGTYNDGNFFRDYDNTFDKSSIKSTTDNSSWRAGGEVKYSIYFKNASTYFGITDTYNRATSDLIENGTPSRSRVGVNNLFIFGQLAGRLFNRLSYTANVGFKTFHSSDGTESRSASRGKASLYLTYNISKPFSLRYMFIYDPSMPGIGNQSELIQSVNELEVRKGNINIKPTMLIKNQITALYMVNNFGASLQASHSRTNNPIFYDYSLITDVTSPYYNRFLGQTVNGRYNENFTVQGEISYRNIFGHLNIGGNGGWSKYKGVRSTWSNSYDFGFGSIYATFFVENFSLSAQYTISPFYSLSGNTYASPERWNTITAQYRWRNWFFNVTAVNLFTKRGGRYHSWSDTPAHTYEDRVDIHNCGNMIMLGVTYRANFGKSMNKGKRTVRNGGVDTGIDMSL